MRDVLGGVERLDVDALGRVPGQVLALHFLGGGGLPVGEGRFVGHAFFPGESRGPVEIARGSAFDASRRPGPRPSPGNESRDQFALEPGWRFSMKAVPPSADPRAARRTLVVLLALHRAGIVAVERVGDPRGSGRAPPSARPPAARRARVLRASSASSATRGGSCPSRAPSPPACVSPSSIISVARARPISRGSIQSRRHRAPARY